jgi:hypothetical protein
MINKKLIKVFCILGMAITFSGCPTGGGTPVPPTTASLSISIKNYISGGAGIQCPATIAWHFEPVSLTGTQGKTSAFDTTGSYNGTSSQIETSGSYPVYGCIYNDSQIGMAAGMWKIRASNGVWTAECQKQLNNSGFNTAEFTINQAGCR